VQHCAPCLVLWESIRLCGDGDLNLDTSLDVDDDLLDNLGWGVQVDETLVDSAQRLLAHVLVYP